MIVFYKEHIEKSFMRDFTMMPAYPDIQFVSTHLSFNFPVTITFLVTNYNMHLTCKQLVLQARPNEPPNERSVIFHRLSPGITHKANLDDTGTTYPYNSHGEVSCWPTLAELRCVIIQQYFHVLLRDKHDELSNISWDNHNLMQLLFLAFIISMYTREINFWLMGIIYLLSSCKNY